MTTTIIAEREETVPEPKIRQPQKPYSKYGIRAVPESKNIRKK